MKKRKNSPKVQTTAKRSFGPVFIIACPYVPYVVTIRPNYNKFKC